MDILGVGFSELIFILVIALMVFGPRRLPEIAAKAGKIVGDLRNMSNGLLAEWQREIRASELHDELTKTRDELVQARDAVNVARREATEQTAEVAKAVTPPKINAGKLMSDEMAGLEKDIAPASPSDPTTKTPSNSKPPAAENSIAPPQESSPSSPPNGVESAAGDSSPNPETVVNEQ